MTNYFTHKIRSKNPAVIAGLVVLGIAAIVGLAILFGFIILWLWNWLMPDLFGLTEITYWQAVGIFILSKILFGGFGGGGKSGKKSSNKDFSCDDKKSSKNEFSKWKLYDKFWQEEGDKAFESYVDRMNSTNNEEE